MLMTDEMVARRFSCATCSKLLSPLPVDQVERLQRCIDEAEDEPDIERMLQGVLSRLVTLAAADRMSVLVPIGRGALRIFTCSEPGQQGDVLMSLDLYPELAHLLRTGEPILVADVSNDELLRPVRHLLRHVGITSVAAVPFSLAEATGVLRIVSRSRPFSPKDLHLLGAAGHLMEHRLQELEDRPWEDDSYRQLLVQMADGIIDLTLDGRICAVDGPFEERFKVKPEVLIGRFLDELLDDLHSGEAYHRLIALLDGGMAWSGACFSARLPGRGPVRIQVWGTRLGSANLHVRLVIRRFGDGVVLGDLLEHAPLPLLVVEGAGGAISVANREAESLLGIPAIQLVGRSLASLLQGNGEHTRTRLLRPDATPVPVRVLMPERSAEEGEASVVALIDLRASPEAQQREAQLRATVQRQLADLEQMQQRLDELESLRSQFLASSAHELKTPITVIQSYLEILLEDLSSGLDEQQLSFLRITYESVQRLRLLVTDIIDLAALEGGKLQLEIARVEVLPVVLPVLEEMQPLASKAGVLLGHADLEQLPALRADGVRVQQVLRNLIDNAIKSTPCDGRVSIHGRAEGDSVVLQVQDTGVGVPAARLPTLFDEFTRSTQSGGRNGTGSGLGLAISRRIMQSLGGRLTVESVEGEGSVFSLHLPQWPDTSE